MSDYNNIIYAIADFFEWTFQILPALGNLPNYLFATLMFIGSVYWLKWQKDLSKEAKENGTIE